jgi:NO-binding membrane sensor protein with MHYT domain
MGIGIWAMHYVGMLAFRLPVPVSYYWPIVLLSLFIGILCSLFALVLVSRKRMSRGYAHFGSVFMGTGIAGLHYVSMAAMRLTAVMRFDPIIVALSVLLAIAFSPRCAVACILFSG